MPPPTRPQIEATITLPTYAVQYWNGSAWTALSNDDVAHVSGGNEAGVGLTFGAFASPGGSIRLWDTSAVAAISANRTRIRVQFGFSTSTQLTRMIGIITDRTRTYGKQTHHIEWTIGGIDQLISSVAIYSPMFYRRLVATPTTATSIEDPTVNGYRGGLINYIFWQCGGRPYEQVGTYPSAVFYYSCQPSLLTPEFSWIAGEDAWQELNRLCKAGAGQIFQDVDGTMRFINAVSVSAAASVTYGTGDAETITERILTDHLATSVRCSYTIRAVQPRQVVYEDATSKLITPGETLTLTIEPMLPVYQWIAPTSDSVYVTDLAMTRITVTPVLSNTTAARATLTITNGDTKAWILSNITVHGRPVAAVAQGQVREGAGTQELPVGEDAGVYVQTRTHAQRLARILADYGATTRAERTLEGMLYDPDRTLAESTNMTLSDWGVSAVNHRTSRISHDDTGGRMNMSVVDVTGLPVSSDLFQVGGTYAAGDTRRVGY